MKSHEPAQIRLSKLMAQRNLCSRRQADEWIARGWVKVNGSIVATLGSRVPENAKIELLAEAEQEAQQKVTIILNKPVGYVSQQAEKGYTPAIRLLTSKNQYRNSASDAKLASAHLKNLAVVGRLDIDSQGLLIFTQDGVLAKRLIGPEARVEKEYIVKVNKPLTSDQLSQLQRPMSLDGQNLRPAQVSRLNPQLLRMILTQGRKRQIRRMCEATGLRVLFLKRVRVGALHLDDLPLGQWKFVNSSKFFN